MSTRPEAVSASRGRVHTAGASAGVSAEASVVRRTRDSSARERRVIAGAVIVLLSAFVITYAIVPAVRRWSERARQIEVQRERIAHLQGLIAAARALDSAATSEENALAGAPRRVLHAPSPALAASALQALLQEAGEGAGLVVTRVDVSPALDSAGGAGGTVAAYGDIRGLAMLLETLASGPRVVMPTSLTVQQNSALRGGSDVVQVVIGVRAPVMVD